MKNVKEPSPMNSSPDASAESPLVSLPLVPVGRGVAFDPTGEDDGGLEGGGGVGPEAVRTDPPTVETGVHWEVPGAGCAAGVRGSPW